MVSELAQAKLTITSNGLYVVKSLNESGPMMRFTSKNNNGPGLSVTELIAAMQCMPVGITIIDSALTIKFWNDAFCTHLDIPNDLMCPGVTMEEVFYFNARRGDYGPGDPVEFVDERMALARRFRPHHFTRTRTNGTILDIAGRPIEDGCGNMVGFVTIYQDVTLDRLHQQQLEAASKDLQIACDELKLAHSDYAALEEDRRKYYQLAVRDPVTDLFTRHYMEDAADRLIEAHERSESAKVSVLIFDIDHFKDINDTHGHLNGDVVLRRVGDLLTQQSRRVDIAIRFGGDEFAAFLSGVGEPECYALAERINQAIATIQFDGRLSTLKLTISSGVAEHRVGESLLDLIQRADDALYKAKRAGRNQICRAI